MMLRSLLSFSLALIATAAVAQNPAADADRAAMMRALGITALIPGANGDPKAPDAASTDEAIANPYPLPDPLRTTDGRPVRTAAQWRDVQRPAIAAIYEREVYGRVPADLPPVRWHVDASDAETIGFGRAVIARRLIGEVTDPRPGMPPVRLRMLVVLPARATAKVPVLMMFGPAAFPAPSQPTADESERIDAALKTLLAERDPALKPIFARHQAHMLAGPAAPRRFDPTPSVPEQIIAAGWGYAMIDPLSAQADDGSGLRSGIIGLANGGAPRRPDQWGALRAWAWAASRGFDWLATDPAVDATRIGIEGVSRYGKAALVTMAFDPRFAVALLGSSGKGGTTPLRRHFGEEVGNLATGEYHWMAGNFLKYDTKGMSPPQLDASALPVDANGLIALCAPRPVYVSYGIPAAGDAPWLDQRGSWMATVDASRVYRLLGASGVADGDYRNVPMPAVLEARDAGELAWRQHDGGHTDAPNIPHFLTWADRVLKRVR